MKVTRLGELLIKDESISRNELEEALKEQETSPKRLGEILITKGYISELRLAEALSNQLNIPMVSLVRLFPAQDLLSLVPENVARRLNVIPLEMPDSKHIVIAMSDPMDTFAIDEIRMLTQLEVIIKVATISDIQNALTSFYKMQMCVEEALIDIQRQDDISEKTDEQGKVTTDVTQETPSFFTTDAPVVKLVSSILEQAVKEKASDIHIEPSERNTLVRFRIDGTMFSSFEIPKNLHPPLVSRIKILSNMDISEKRRPQDGRILMKDGEKRIDLRVSSVPSIFGEKIVLRLLDQSNESIGMEKLGFEPELIQRLDKVITSPHGIFLVTGPTGSGKSTTLYSILEIISTPAVNVMTLEDPVEYTIPGITQIQVNEKIDVTFSNTLRSILRQDPDKLMIGEIRDTETAQLAVRVALTGHFILSTLHTNDAPSAINRLIDMNVPAYLLSSSLRGVLAQRLVRKLCPNCKARDVIPTKLAEELGLPKNTNIFKPVGCPSCRYTAYIGRTVVSELMIIDATLRQMINSNESVDKIREYACKKGMKLLKESALEKVLDGVTSIEEMLSITIAD